MTRILALLVLLAALPAQAASFYISTTGNDTNGCTNQTTDACASFPRCCTVMAAGDTCYALDGTYNVYDTDGANDGWQFDCVGGTGTSARKRFTSLSQDATKVTIKSATPLTQNTLRLLGDDTIPGTGRAAYLEFDHLTFEGRMASYGNTDGLYYHHNVGRCPNVGTGGGNHGFIYTRSVPTDMHKDIVIRENYFVIDSACEAIMERPPPNGCVLDSLCYNEMVILYHTNGAVVEYNDFVNTSSRIALPYYLYVKEGNKDAQIRYNYLQLSSDTDHGGAINAQNCGGTGLIEWNDRSSQGGSPLCANEYHNNIIVGGDSGPAPFGKNIRNEKIYNNTVVNVATRCLGSGTINEGSGASGNEVFNTICYNTTRPYGDAMFSWPAYGSGTLTCASQQGYIDNNLYRQTVSPVRWRDCATYPTYTTLATWQTHMADYGFEANSAEADPLFESGSYKLQAGSPARSGGRGGAYSSYRGAYITADQSDQIGCSWHPDCYSYGETAPPATSGNPRRVDLKGVTFK